MESKQFPTNQSTDDLSLYGLFALFFQNWLTLVISGFSFAIIALVWSIKLADVYKAETVLMPVTDDQSALGGISGDLGGLAAVAGLSLGEGGDENSKLALEMMESYAFIGEFIEENELIVPIMAAKDWDRASNTLVIDPKVYDQENKVWTRKPRSPRRQIPTTQETYDEFMKLLEIEQDPKTNFITVSVEFYSPHLAAEWTRKLVDKINKKIRAMDKEEAASSINYLKQLAQESNVQELRKSFTSLMEDQIKSHMLTEIRKDYVFKVVDPAVAPELKDKPKRSIIIIIAGFVGGIVGLIIILFRTGRREHIAKQRAKQNA